MLKLLVSVSNFWFLLGWSSCTKLLQTTVQLPNPVTTQPTNTKLELVCQSLSLLLACYGNSSAIILPGTNFPERGLWAGMADGNRINQPIIGSGVSVRVWVTHNTGNRYLGLGHHADQNSVSAVCRSHASSLRMP